MSEKLFSYLSQFGLETTWEALIYNLSHNANFRRHEKITENILESKTYYEISDLYEESLAFVNKQSKKKNGQYYTPQDVSCFLAKQVLKFHDSTWCDPCCGIGNISYELLKLKPELIDTMVFYDIDAVALKICRFLLSHFFNRNFEDLKNFRNESFLDANIDFDYIIMNPPYGGGVKEDLYITFMKKACSCKGFISITPQSFTNVTNKSAIELKEKLLEFSFLNIYCFDNVPDCIFNGRKKGIFNTNTSVSVRAAITVANNQKEEKKITPLIRWKTADRKKMFETCQENFSNLFYKKNKFLKILPKTEKFLDYGDFELKDIISKNGSYSLTIPSSPRYFISASVRELNRSSKHIIHFDSLENMKIAYLFINSSYMYWWWLANDDGFSLTYNTLISLRIKNIINDELYNKLLEEENTCLVTKKNAGRMSENIKHSMEIIKELDLFINFETL